MTSLLTVLFSMLKLVFNLVLFVLWIRVAIVFFKFSRIHPVSRMIDELTNPLIQPLKNLFGFKVTPSRFDKIGFIAILLVEIIKFILLGLIAYGRLLPLPYLFIFLVGDLLMQPCNLLFYAVIIRVVMSWVNPEWRHPFAEIINMVTTPPLAFIQRYIPPIAGFDFSPLVLIIALSAVTLFISVLVPFPFL